MTDLKAGVKIEFDFMDEVYEFDGYINWSAENDGVDDRVRDFFKESYDDGILRYQRRNAEYFAKCDRERKEETERAELARLKSKYEPTDVTR